MEIYTLRTFFIGNAKILSLMAHFLNGFTVSQFISKGCYLLCGHKFRLWSRMLRDVWKNYLVDGGSYFCVAFCSCFEIYAGGGRDTGGWNAWVLNIPCKNVEGKSCPQPNQDHILHFFNCQILSKPFTLLLNKVKIKFIKEDVFILCNEIFFYLMLWFFDLWRHNDDMCNTIRSLKKKKEQKCVV